MATKTETTKEYDIRVNRIALRSGVVLCAMTLSTALIYYYFPVAPQSLLLFAACAALIGGVAGLRMSGFQLSGRYPMK